MFICTQDFSIGSILKYVSLRKMLEILNLEYILLNYYR